MFFVFGISGKEKAIDFSQTIVCPCCESYGRLEVFMTYSYFSLFFIPLIKWNKRYYGKTICCGSLYTIDYDLGKNIEKGKINKIDVADLKPVKINHKGINLCGNCNYPIDSGFAYCPKCGQEI